MSLFGFFSGGEPAGIAVLADGDHIPYTFGEIIPLLDDGAPCGPDGGRACLVQREDVVKGLHIFGVEGLVVGHLHVVGVGGPLGIDVEHDEAVIAVAQCDALHRLQGIVQIVGGGGGGVDAHTDEGFLSPGAQNVTVFGVEVGDIEPLVDIVVGAGQGGLLQSGGEFHQFQFVGLTGGDMHVHLPFS